MILSFATSDYFPLFASTWPLPSFTPFFSSCLFVFCPSHTPPVPPQPFHSSAPPHHPPCRSFFAPSFPLRLSPHYPFSSSISHDAQVQPTAPICPDSELCRKQFPALSGPSWTGLRQIGHDGKSRQLRNSAAVEN